MKTEPKYFLLLDLDIFRKLFLIINFLKYSSLDFDMYFTVAFIRSQSYMSNLISSGMGMDTGGIPTTDNIPDATEKLGCPTDNIPEATEKLGCPTDNIPEATENLGCPISIYFKVKCQSKCKIMSKIICRFKLFISIF